MIPGMRPSPKSLILDLLSTLAGGTMPVGALVQAGRLFELAENSTRVALARLLASGQVERDERGRYRLGGRAAPVDRQVHAWRRLEDRLTPWDGSWVGACAGAVEGGSRARALRLLGFRELAPGLEVRPQNLHGGANAVREELRQLGLGDALVFELTGLDLATQLRATRLWDVEELRRTYLTCRAELEDSRKRLVAAGEREGMVESYIVGGRVIRQLAFDPLLPEPILPAAERDALVEAMRRYDQLGRAHWAGFLERHGVLARGTPLHARLPEARGPESWQGAPE
jgi:phenylacetic acid degradation operon negative regulatory protein